MLAKLFFALTVACSLYVGAYELSRFKRSLINTDEFMQISGEILSINRILETSGDHGQQVSQPIPTFELKYEYQVNGEHLTSDVVSVFFNRCTENDLKKITGKSVSMLASGSEIVVFVSKANKQSSFLILPTFFEKLKQFFFILFFVIIIPSLAFAFFRAWWTQPENENLK